MRRGFRSGILLAFGLTLSLFISEKSFCKQVVVAVTQLVAHPAVDAVREGIKESLKAEGYIEGDNMRFVFANAHGNIATANQIAQKFAGMSPDVIVAITTPSAQSFMSFIKNSNIPLIFAGVTNPISGRLVKDMNHPGGNVTGTSDKPKIPEQIGLIRKILRKDGLITVGVVYNSGEANSVEQVQAAKIEATRNNIRLIAKPADNSTKVIGTAERLIPEVDAIYVPLDNTVAAVIPSLVRLGQDNSTGKKVPLFASDPEGVRQGAVATIGFTHYQEGMQTGKIVARVLRGEFPGNIPVRAPDTSALYINETAFKLSGLTIPNELLSQHSEVVRFE